MKNILTFFIIFFCSVSFAQRNLQYSKLFDSYYTEGPVRFSLDPGVSIQQGISYSFGASIIYQENAPLDAVVGLRTFGLQNGSMYQLNVLGRFYLRYDKVRTQRDRRRGPKFWKFYVLSGLSVAKKPGGFQIDSPIGIGMPFRLSDRVSIVPEFSYYYGLSAYKYSIATINIEINPKGKRRKPIKPKPIEGVSEESDGSEDGDSTTPSNNSDGDVIEDNTDDSKNNENNNETTPIEEDNSEEDNTQEEDTNSDEEDDDDEFDDDEFDDDGGF